MISWSKSSKGGRRKKTRKGRRKNWVEV